MQTKKMKLHFDFTIESGKDHIDSNIKVNVDQGTTIGEILQNIDFALNHLNEMKNDCIIKFVNQ